MELTKKKYHPNSYKGRIRKAFKKADLVLRELSDNPTKKKRASITRRFRAAFKNMRVRAAYPKDEGILCKLMVSFTYRMPIWATRPMPLVMTLSITDDASAIYEMQCSLHPESANFNQFKIYPRYKEALYRFERKLVDKKIRGLFKKNKKKGRGFVY